MSLDDLYNSEGAEEKEQSFTLSILTENKIGLVHKITIIFTRRKLNIESINASETEVEGVYRYTIVVNTTPGMVGKLVKQINKQIDVLGAFVYTDEEIHHQEVALYKISTDSLRKGHKMEMLIRNNGARILVIEDDYLVIEKTGHKSETSEMFEKLQPYGVMEFVRSGRISISQSRRQTHSFIRELEEAPGMPENVNMKYLQKPSEPAQA